MNTHDDYPERDYPTLPPLPQNIRHLGGTLGWSIILWMFNNPYKGYLLPDRMPSNMFSWYPEFIVLLLQLGIVAMNAIETGYTLTANGRLYVAEELERAARIEHREWLRDQNRPFDEEDLAHISGDHPNAWELWHRISETY